MSEYLKLEQPIAARSTLLCFFFIHINNFQQPTYSGEMVPEMEGEKKKEFIFQPYDV